MQIGLNGLTYLPTIFLRPAELNAVEHLSDADKDAIVPLFLLKPWATSKTISKAMDKIESSYSGRSYFLQCDPEYTKDGEPTQAGIEFASLCDKAGNEAAWWQLIADRPRAIPTVPLSLDQAKLTASVRRADSFGRGFMLRIRSIDGIQISHVINALANIEHNEYAVCLDVGWGRDILSSELWADAWIKALVAANDEVRIVVSGSSFPREFSKYGTFGEEASLERVLHANLAKKNNQANLIYGDWGSSRSKFNQGGGVVIPRIDVPRQRSWYIFRAATELGTYKKTAETALDSKKWEYDPDVWGKYVIRNTSLGKGYVIDSPKKSTEVRINIHLHQQISGSQGPGGQYIEVDFVD